MNPTPLDLRTPAQVRALASPIRQELLEQLGTESLTVSELARRTGRKAPSLYFHLESLVEAGLVSAAPNPRRRAERLFRVQSDKLEAKGSDASPAARRAIQRSGAAVLRRVQRDYLRALAEPGALEKRRGHALRLTRMTARLSPAALARVQGHLEALQRELTARRGEEGRLFAVTVALLPVRDRSPGKG